VKRQPTPAAAGLEAIYRSHGAQFQRVATAIIGDSDAAREAVQEGFARALRRVDSYRGTGSLEGWAAKCVVNVARDTARAARRRGVDEYLGDNADAHEPASSEGTSMRARLVRDALLLVPQRQREALFLRYYLDLDYAAIGEALEIQAGTVSATLHAGRAALAQLLQEVPG
jgi:RNA polymerase sigma factor (sigma-70 family)